MVEIKALTGARYPALGAGGPRFKSGRPDHSFSFYSTNIAEGRFSDGNRTKPDERNKVCMASGLEFQSKLLPTTAEP